YLTQVLPSLGMLVQGYFAIGHNSLDNYVAQISGQAPNPQTQEDCNTVTDWVPPDPVATPVGSVSPGVQPQGQEVGQGCVYPSTVQTLADQLDGAIDQGGQG